MPFEIDARGLPCPQPVLKTKEALDKSKGEALSVIVSTTESRDNVIRFLTHSGVEIDRTEEKAGNFYIYTKQTTGVGSTVANPADYVCSTPPAGSGTVVFINKDRIGHGSDELGQNLMKVFITTIKDLSVQPKAICFMNSGVKLTVHGSETQPYLKELEERGIELLVCGTCLNYYEVKDKIGAGRISNMYDIAETMLKSSKVITV